MTKTFCDRCGREIDRNARTLFRHRTAYAETLLSRPVDGNVTHVLCPSCEDSLIYWFNHAETWVARKE